MERQTKDNLMAGGTWKRLLYMLLFAVVFNIAEIVIGAVVVIQFLFKLFTGEVVPKLRHLGQGLGAYVGEIIRFLTYDTEDMPYPFAPWPAGAAEKPRQKAPPAKRGGAKGKTGNKGD